ncbi:C69 family dipeptidase [Promethearchaeum syntrophicum]|uniref:C69 family dipeptidase n=1 Tax=Promethearchaeum syntrophicum TaxID=2594042 RepID=A0A5B9D720_9ARCH|nr:C69 family dipeptidase [Candidatus Prometheoarchaeum syntrophicum]QEE14924.1 Peptidase family C69 [Candidatus Prometheoarchaeum syntrophicum]
MCDTIVALGTATKDGDTLFGKNSDREPDEVQNLDIFERKNHGSNENVKCTYIKIPQVQETYRTLLSKPFWMFGAEMGINEYGVAIGNEALLTKIKPKKSALTGMDLLRLALERSKTAKQARDVIIQLLEQYGQGGNCGYLLKDYYQNGFIIADKDEAYVLETIDKNWAWKEIDRFWSISNKISIEKDYDSVSPGLIHEAVKRGWASSESDFNFSKAYSDKIITWGAAGKKREQSNRCYLSNNQSSLKTSDFMKMLRSHTDKTDWKPHKGFRLTVCAHAANSLSRYSQTVGSLISKIGKENVYAYSTGSSNPCLSPYFPIFAPNTNLPKGYVKGGEKLNTDAFWWKAEKFHRKAIMNYTDSRALLDQKMGEYEKQMLDYVENHNAPLNQKLIDEYFSKVENIYTKWGKEILSLPNMKGKFYYKHFWGKFTKTN